jgi:hypothetical protein
MEDVLAVYTRPRDGDCPLVCLDETSKQLIAETRVPISMKAGHPARFDYEYERNGTANLFIKPDVLPRPRGHYGCIISICMADLPEKLPILQRVVKSST